MLDTLRIPVSVDINNVRVIVLETRVHFPDDAKRQEYWEALVPDSIGMVSEPLR